MHPHKGVKIGIVGIGFVGSAVANKFQELFQVETFDLDPSKCTVEDLNTLGRECEVTFVCVPTPQGKDGAVDTSIVKKVVEELAPTQVPIIIKSTVPPGFTKSLGLSQVCFSPEFLTEANHLEDFANQENTIVGVHDPEAINPAERCAIAILQQGLPESNVHITNHTTAEVVKYARNCFLAAKVSFFNEIYELCELIEVEYDEAKDLVVLDERIGSSHTQVPGPDGKLGFGGSCFPKDTMGLFTHFTKVLGKKPKVLESVIASNRLHRGKTSSSPSQGFVAGSFDLLHPGHLMMLKDAASVCDYLVVGLQSDPTLDRPQKNKPIQSVEERMLQLEALSVVDEVVVYDTEADLVKVLEELKPDIRIQGSDWEGKSFTGDHLDIPIYHHHRTHNWSSSELRNRIMSENGPN